MTIESFGRVDVVVYNDGITPLSPIAKGDVDTFDKGIATNLRGTFLVFAQAAQNVAEGGRIIAYANELRRRNILMTCSGHVRCAIQTSRSGQRLSAWF